MDSNKICTPYCGHVYIINTLSKENPPIRFFSFALHHRQLHLTEISLLSTHEFFFHCSEIGRLVPLRLEEWNNKNAQCHGVNQHRTGEGHSFASSSTVLFNSKSNKKKLAGTRVASSVQKNNVPPASRLHRPPSGHGFDWTTADNKKQQVIFFPCACWEE